MKAIQLECPKYGRFHFGKTGLEENASLHRSEEIIHSDTLFSAIISTCSKVFPDQLEALLEAFKDKEGSIKLSSAFPCWNVNSIHKKEKKEDRHTIFFLPKPVHLELYDENEEADIDRKKIQRIAYISKTIWDKGIAPKYWCDKEDCILIDKKYLVHRDDLYKEIALEIEDITTIQTVPKIADHIRQPSDNIFFQTDLYFNSFEWNSNDFNMLNLRFLSNYSIQPHFYFLLDINLNDTNRHLEKVLDVLLDIIIDEGIGGSISTGAGRLISKTEIENFKWQIKEQDIAKNHAVTMSLYCPSDHEELQKVQFGKIITRGGRLIGKEDQLKRVKMFQEGALIKHLVKGSIPSIHDSKPYLRYGRAFMIPVHQNYV